MFSSLCTRCRPQDRQIINKFSWIPPLLVCVGLFLVLAVSKETSRNPDQPFRFVMAANHACCTYGMVGCQGPHFSGIGISSSTKCFLIFSAWGVSWLVDGYPGWLTVSAGVCVFPGRHTRYVCALCHFDMTIDTSILLHMYTCHF